MQSPRARCFQHPLVCVVKCDNFVTRRRLLVGAAASALSLGARSVRPATRSARVVFLNPGESVERSTGKQWQLVVRFMAAAAKALDMQLEVLYAERDYMLMLRQAEAVANRSSVPDYVVVVNEKGIAPRIFDVLRRIKSRIVLIHNDLTDQQRAVVGDERGQIANWIGTVTADARRGGYRLMNFLCRSQTASQPSVIGITGDPMTPVSTERAQGVRDWLAAVPNARLNQLVYSDWSFSDSYEKVCVLLKRYPDTNLIWAANDSMTLGALNACRTCGGRAAVGGMGALPEALIRVKSGGLSAMMAGDYFIGAFAMVLIHDHYHGVDFALLGGARKKLDFLTVVSERNAASYYELLFGGLGDPDFSIFSKYIHPGSGGYDFQIDRLLSHVKKFS